METAQAIVEQVPEVRAATVYILSQIGHPLDEPLVATAQINTRNGELKDSVRAAVAEVINAKLQDIDGLRERILARKLAVC